MLYERSGVGDYWIVDPDVPHLTALRLEGERYREIAVVEGDDVHRATTPFAVDVTPADLVALSSGR